MRIFQVDAFTDSAFAGNPAAVCLLDRPADARWMQQLAAEMNLAETAFVEPRPGGYLLRWFTPVVEVVLCGHATLASAHVLYETGLAAAGEPIAFQSASGPLAARQDDGSIVLDFPATPRQPAVPAGRHAGRARRHGAGLDRPRAGGFHDRGGDRGRVDRPAAGPGQLVSATIRGVIVTAPAARAGADFVSRFFAPAVGIPEDPVTGSAHCTLAPYWCGRLGRTELTGFQASPRGGTVRVRVAGDRVMLSGHALTVLAGELTPAALPPGG